MHTATGVEVGIGPAKRLGEEGDVSDVPGLLWSVGIVKVARVCSVEKLLWFLMKLQMFGVML